MLAMVHQIVLLDTEKPVPALMLFKLEFKLLIKKYLLHFKRIIERKICSFKNIKWGTM